MSSAERGDGDPGGVGGRDGERFDYVVVGAGSAGAALASRLSEDPARTVLLLEAGGSDRRPSVQLPLGYGLVYNDPRVNWRYLTEPVPGLGGRRSYWPRGRVLGGSSAINAMVWVRGHPHDYDGWAREAPGWAWVDVAPVFRRIEDWAGGADEHRGAGGPVPVSDIAADAHPLCERFFAACAELGLPRAADYNGASMEGVGHYQITTRAGLRASSARCYLHPARHRPNLVVRTGARATRLLLAGRRVRGVEYRRGGRGERVAARAEVVLAAGAVNSPQLLQLSGLGPPTLLAAHGIAVRRPLAAVGRHLQDHLGADLILATRVPTLNQVLGSWRGRARVGLEWLLHRRGPLALSLNQAGGFVRSRPDLASPDLQLYFSPVSYTRAPPGLRPLIRPDPFPAVLLGFNPCRPTSRGTIEIASADPFAAPRIRPNYLASADDRAAMLAGMRLLRALAATPALGAVVERELAPGADVADDAALLEFVRAAAWTVFHPCATCRMGTGPATSVVDPRLRVHGVEGLRVADASVFPSVPSGNTNAPAIMVGERAAALIVADERRAAAG